MKTKIHYKTEIKKVPLSTGYAEIHISWKLPSKELVQSSQLKEICAEPVIESIMFSPDSYEYNYQHDGFIFINYLDFLLIQEEIKKVLSDFHKIKRDEYLEIYDSLCIFDDATEKINLPIFGRKSPEKIVSKICTVADKMKKYYDKNESVFNEKEKRFLNKAFDTIDSFFDTKNKYLVIISQKEELKAEIIKAESLNEVIQNFENQNKKIIQITIL
jgi:hypothetical protein